MTSQTRRDSVASHHSTSQTSQTAREFIESQLQLEADAREALPYSFDSCTYPLGPLRQSLFACLTCSPADSAKPAGVCYSCSIACHGEHTLVELFSKRNFVCDCGTTRLSSSSPCMLRTNQETGAKGARDDQPGAQNSYNQNFQNKFCGCGEAYDSEKEKGTMFQCLGLGTVEDGGCGEDWWHPECLVGLPRDWHRADKSSEEDKGKEDKDKEEKDKEEEEPPLPPGFPGEDDFEAFLCYKCIDSNPWLKSYAGTTGFLPAVHYKGQQSDSKKRKLDDQEESHEDASKRPKTDDASNPGPKPAPQQSGKPESDTKPDTTDPPHKHTSLPPPTPNRISLFLREDFRDHLCHCPTCFPNLARHPQLREEEDTYEPPLSDDGNEPNGGGSTGTGSLLDRGEAALSNIDRVRAIEGAMVYNHLRDKVKEFLTPFAESGQAVGAEDIKTYFENLRGDEQGIRDAAGQASSSRDDRDHAGDREQSGY